MNSRYAALALLICSVAFFSLARGDDAAKQDQAALQGEWSMVSGERGGSAMPDAMVKTGKRLFKGDELTVTVGGMTIMKATVTLDPTKQPKAIDYKITDGPNKGKTQLGIYELKDDTVKFCFSNPGDERPAAFETKSGDGRTLSVWKRAGAQ